MTFQNIKTLNNNNDEIETVVQQFQNTDLELQQEAANKFTTTTTTTTSHSFVSSSNNKQNDDITEPNNTNIETNHPRCPFRFIPLKMGGNGRSHKVSSGSRNLIHNEVSLQDLTNMTNTFYELAFQDATLDKFIRSHDDPHGERFAKWIHQKLSGSSVWDQDRALRDTTPVTVARGQRVVVHDRTSAHVAAWYSPKREKHDVGRHFTLEECRVWMRLHFWAMRSSGILEKSPSFADYYVRFIGHFVSVYERTAPTFARESFRWSENPDNIETYIVQNKREMKDVLGLNFQQAIRDLPDDELNDDEWPYNNKSQ